MTRKAMLAGVQSPGRFNHARQTEGEKSDQNQTSGPPGWGLDVWLATSPRKKPFRYGRPDTTGNSTNQDAGGRAHQATDHMTDEDQTSDGVPTSTANPLARTNDDNQNKLLECKDILRNWTRAYYLLQPSHRSAS